MTWRVGHKVPRNLYLDDEPIAMLATPELAASIAGSLNEREELRAEVARLSDEAFRIEDDRDHLYAFYKELVALILHGDWEHPVDMSPGSGIGTKAMEEVTRLRGLDTTSALPKEEP